MNIIHVSMYHLSPIKNTMKSKHKFHFSLHFETTSSNRQQSQQRQQPISISYFCIWNGSENVDLYFDNNNNNNRFRKFITEIYIHFDMILQSFNVTHPEQATAASSHAIPFPIIIFFLISFAMKLCWHWFGDGMLAFNLPFLRLKRLFHGKKFYRSHNIQWIMEKYYHFAENFACDFDKWWKLNFATKFTQQIPEKPWNEHRKKIKMMKIILFIIIVKFNEWMETYPVPVSAFE